MSFRSRLTLFFVLIVIVPMVSLTVVLFRLIADNENGKADAGVAARQEAAIRLVDDGTKRAVEAAAAIGRDRVLAGALQTGDQRRAQKRATQLLTSQRAKRIVISGPGSRVQVDAGSHTAVFPAKRRLQDASGRSFGTLEVAVTGPKAFTSLTHSVTGLDLVLRSEQTVLASSLDTGAKRVPTSRRRVTFGGRTYRATTFSAPGFRATHVSVTTLDATAQTAADIRRSRLFAAGILLGFFILAFTFAVLVSRSLQQQISSFLHAAERLGGGDFTAKVPTAGRDEFAALGDQFNQMSTQLEQRLEDLRQEQARLANAMRRIGDTFASNLDRDALLEIVLLTALDGAGARGGRAMVGRRDPVCVAQAGELANLGPALQAAEAAALRSGTPQDESVGLVHALAHPLRGAPTPEGEPLHVGGVVSVARADRPFSPSERELFHYLAGQASVSVENVGLHETVERQAVTDELTGLSNRRRFQETIATELERSRRFDQPLGLVMLDIDNFKRVNDTHGHQLGDEVLRQVSAVLRASSREIDEPARYGGEELCVVLPNTDLEGAYNLAERVREGIEEIAIPLAGGGVLKVTASLGAATRPESADDERDLIEAADLALYEAKHAGKNQTRRAAAVPSR